MDGAVSDQSIEVKSTHERLCSISIYGSRGLSPRIIRHFCGYLRLCSGHLSMLHMGNAICRYGRVGSMQTCFGRSSSGFVNATATKNDQSNSRFVLASRRIATAYCVRSAASTRSVQRKTGEDETRSTTVLPCFVVGHPTALKIAR